MQARVVRLLDRIFARRVRLVVGFGIDLVSNVALGLSALGVTQVPAPWLLLIGVGIGTALLASVIWSYHIDLRRRLAPVKVGAEINELRKRLRDLTRDAYVGPAQVPEVIWQGRCAQLVEDCESFVAGQRNKYVIPLADAIVAKQRRGARPDMHKNVHAILMLRRVDEVLAQIHAELRYE